MVIDSSAAFNITHDGDFKVKKSEEVQEIKPVEGLGNSNESALDIDRDRVTEKKPETRQFDTGDMYKQNGEIDREGNQDKNTEINAKTIDMVI